MTDAIMQRERTRHPLLSMLYQGEPTLRYLAEMCTKRAELLEQEAAIERERPMHGPRRSGPGTRRASGCAGKPSPEGHVPADPQACLSKSALGSVER
jgi:hypothetical protein